MRRNNQLDGIPDARRTREQGTEAQNPIKKRDFIMQRHIYLILWTLGFFMLYFAVYSIPVVYTITYKLEYYKSEHLLRPYCLIGMSFGTVINSVLFAFPMIRQKIR